MGSLLDAVRENEEAARFLAWPGDFEPARRDHVEEVRLASGAALEGFAGDGAGGTYFFCGDGGEERPVLYADSEGRAALVAIGLTELLGLLLAAPWWRGGGAAEYLADMPDLPARRDGAAAALGLALPTEAEALARLREVATGPGKEYVLVLTSEEEPYEPLPILNAPGHRG
ncbi:hypothetical protein [Streptomyces sp. R44]|uniref:SMI1/KNR4 family protein n=1 Tax=Streptomyces sp. R44 TaxID=3238633 RepID=A0AB39SYG4_9ACTN